MCQFAFFILTLRHVLNTKYNTYYMQWIVDAFSDWISLLRTRTIHKKRQNPPAPWRHILHSIRRQNSINFDPFTLQIDDVFYGRSWNGIIGPVLQSTHCLGMNYYVNFLGDIIDSTGFHIKWIFCTHSRQLKKSKFWGPFWSYQLNSTANSASHHENGPNRLNWQCCLANAF